MSRRLLRETANGGNQVAIGGNWMQASIADKMIEPVSLNLEGWNGSMTELRKLAKDWYSQNLQGKSFPNDDMGVDVGFGSEGKGTAFHTSGNTRTGWKAEMVKVLPGLVKRAVKIGETSPDERRNQRHQDVPYAGRTTGRQRAHRHGEDHLARGEERARPHAQVL
ncbi:hypothetical protein AGMMS49543_26960 [Betaproteobacteria bacterium]|nr:hypothetical protein AGMMS49543_26960 [Betaproteobacteria bacterium]GHU24385.1 hypothetical protein AGMMS50243_27430 [Betaproteobacteria bacterium]